MMACGGLLGHHLPAVAGVGGLDDVAVLVHHPVHHVGGDQVPAVGYGRSGGDHVEGGDGEVLAEGFHRQVGRRVDQLLLALWYRVTASPGKVDAGALGKAEGLPVLGEGLARLSSWPMWMAQGLQELHRPSRKVSRPWPLSGRNS